MTYCFLSVVNKFYKFNGAFLASMENWTASVRNRGWCIYQVSDWIYSVAQFYWVTGHCTNTCNCKRIIKETSCGIGIAAWLCFNHSWHSDVLYARVWVYVVPTGVLMACKNSYNTRIICQHSKYFLTVPCKTHIVASILSFNANMRWKEEQKFSKI